MAAIMNSITVGIIGTLLLKAYASTRTKKRQHFKKIIQYLI